MAKKDTTQVEPYTQVFNDKHGFINNLSILDLLFNEGRYALDYLKINNYNSFERFKRASKGK